MAENPFASIKPQENSFAHITPTAAGDQVAADDEIGSTVRPYAVDALKQAGAGLVTGVEAIPAAPAQAAGLLGRLAEKVLPSSFISPEAQQQQRALHDVIKQNRGEGIANYLPEAQTEFGKSVRGIMEFVPSTVASTGLSIPPLHWRTS